MRPSGGPPTPPLWWMPWAPLAVTAVFGMFGLGVILRWLRRGWNFPLGVMCLGLVASAALTVAMTAAQLLPVVEFTQRTSRAAAAGTHEIYDYSLEPYRLIEMAWPNIFGDQFAGNTFWGDIIRIPGVRPKLWVPSLYAGGLTLVLAVASISFRKGPPWRIWLSVIVVVSVLGSLGQYSSPIWGARTRGPDRLGRAQAMDLEAGGN